MAREVKNRVSLDASRFSRGTNQIRRNIKQLEKGLTIDLKRATQLGGRALFAVGAAGAAVATGLAVGINKVVQLGAELDHLKTQTGIAVGEMLILQQAFEDGGVSASKVGQSISRMQRSIVDAGDGLSTPIRALELLNIEVKDLQGLSPSEQFAMISDAIAGVSDPAEKAAAAMGIFGRSGAEMMTVFQDGAIDDAAASLGAQAQLLEKNSVMFERVSTLMARSGNKLQGFFVGIADKVVPVILPLLEKLDGLDLADQGQAFGQSLQTGLRAVLGVFENGTLGKIIGESLKVAGIDFINAIARGWIGIAKGFWEMFKTGWSENFKALKSGFEILARTFAITILDALSAAADLVGAKGKAISLSQSAANQEAKLRDAKEEFRGSTSLGTRIEKLAEAFQSGMADLDGFDLLGGTDGRKAEIGQLIADAIAATQPAGPMLGPQNQPTPISAFGDAEQTALPAAAVGAEVSKALTGGVSSLAAIGGGGGVGTSGVESLVDQSREQTSVLKNIDRGIKQMGENIRNTLYGTPSPAFLQ